MTSDLRNGRSLETVRAELRAIESREHPGADPALLAHVDHLRREHEEVRRAHRRELEDDLLTVPGGAPHVPGRTPGVQPAVDAAPGRMKSRS